MVKFLLYLNEFKEKSDQSTFQVKEYKRSPEIKLEMWKKLKQIYELRFVGI